MKVNDLVQAAVSGDTVTVRSILQAEPGLLVQPIRTKNGEDGAIEFPPVFLILSKTAGNIPYPVLDVLSEAGADYSAAVTQTVGGKRIVQPLLEFAITRWHDPRLTAYLLSHGADPNAVDYNEAASVKPSVTTMLTYALTGWKNEKMTELLLTCGADPEKCSRVFSEEHGVFQQLPPLYYALVEKQSAEKTAALLRFGASADCPIDTGWGPGKDTSFGNYLRLTHPELESVMLAARDLAASLPAPTVRRFTKPKQPAAPHQQEPVRAAEPARPQTSIRPSADADVVQPSKTADRIQQAEAPEPIPQPLPPQTAQKPPRAEAAPAALPQHVKLYGKFRAYLFANFAFLALGFGVIGPLIYMKQDKEIALIFFIIGIPCFLIAALIWHSVSKKAKLYGLTGVMPAFVANSVWVMFKVMMLFSIILIPLALGLGKSLDWETRYTDSGEFVQVYQTGYNEYRDAKGNVYHEKED